MFPKDVPLNDMCLSRFANIAYACGEDGIAIVNLAILGKETNQTLDGDEQSGESQPW